MSEPGVTILSLPAEILEDTFGYLRGEEEVSFRSLSLVARAFARPAQRYILHTLSIDITKYDSPSEILEFLHGSPSHIRNAVRHVELKIPQNKSGSAAITQRPLAALLALLPGATHLTLDRTNIEYSPADEEYLARTGWGRGGRNLHRLDLYYMARFHDKPREYVSIFSLFSSIGTLCIQGLIGVQRLGYIPTQTAFAQLDYLPVRSLGIRSVKLLTFSNLSWIALLSNTRSALGSAEGEEGPTLQELELPSLDVNATRALGQLFRLGGKNMRHVNLSIGRLDYDSEISTEDVALLLSLGSSCPNLETLTLNDFIENTHRWQRTLELMTSILYSLRRPIDKFILVLDARYTHLYGKDILLEEYPLLWDAVSTWLRDEHTLQVRVVFQVGAMSHGWGNGGVVVQTVEDSQLAATPVAPYVRSGSLVVEWHAY